MLFPVMVTFNVKWTGFGISWETHLWICLQGCLQRGLTEVGTPILGVGGIIPQAGVLHSVCLPSPDSIYRACHMLRAAQSHAGSSPSRCSLRREEAEVGAHTHPRSKLARDRAGIQAV